MPLSIEGRLLTAQGQRDSDEKFIEKFGVEKLKQKLEQQGVYAYGFASESIQNRCVDLLFEMSEEYLWDDEKIEMKKKYFGERGHRRWFNYSLWSSNIRDSRYVVVIEKPFPKGDYDQRLEQLKISFREVSVYRFAELTDDEIRNPGLGAGVWWMSSCYIDLDNKIKLRRDNELIRMR